MDASIMERERWRERGRRERGRREHCLDKMERGQEDESAELREREHGGKKAKASGKE